MEPRIAFGKHIVVSCWVWGGLWVRACFTACEENKYILSGQTQHPRELIEHDWVRICGRHVKQTANALHDESAEGVLTQNTAVTFYFI